MQQWYATSDPTMENAPYEIVSMRRFAGLELIEGSIPDETTILRFRRLLERHGLTKQMLEIIKPMLEARGALLKGGIMVDATISHASPSTRRCMKRGRAISSTSG